MTKLILSTALVAAFAAAKASSNPQSEKKAVWASIRSTYGIPSFVKLGCDFGGTNEVYVKGSEPRSFLLVNDAGRYTGTGTGTGGGVGSANAGIPTAVDAPTPIAPTTKFAAADSANDQVWHVVSRSELLALLREGAPSGDSVGPLPDGFPTTLGADAVVLDSTSGNLFYRA